MSQHQQLPDSEGLQVNTDSEQAAKAPEVAPGYDNGSYYIPPGYHHPQQPSSDGARIPFGLGVWTFAALVALCTAIVVGAGVGGGLGAALANKSSDCSADSVSATAPAATAEPTSTSCPTPDNSTTVNDTAPYVPRAADTVSLLELDCPDNKKDETRYKTSKGYEFQWWCGVNAGQGSPAEGGGIVADYAPIYAYTIEDCMEACGNMIDKDAETGNGVKCASIVFSKRMKAELDNLNANCWLKNNTKLKGGNWGFKDDWYAYAELDN
ncbi:hypothetical protein FBEOM_9446 [Fusarium beomiforme]|uniref:Apple domain-containing protein n=1 Tax=Fusarium beomiforme TaxID=44412 RepID=A0A9P5DV81_9HYPO|nr:hypothetical protein FBEOM_9446 [Fusarium beomiforme]